MWEAAIQRTVAPGQPGWRPHLNEKQKKKLDVMVHACHPSNGRKHKIGGSPSRQFSWAKSETLSSK
jgi:hypothetical protein